MNIILVEPPDVTPVSLEDIYLFLRLEPEGSPPEHPDDSMLETMIQAATEKVQAATNRALVQQTIRLVLPSFATEKDQYGKTVAGIELKRPPFREMVSVKYLDAAGDEQTMAEDAYYVSDQALVPKLYAVGGWPATLSGRNDAVRIEYVVGYEPVDSSDLTGNIPAGLLAAVKFEVQLQYDELTPEKRKQLEDSVARLIGHHRIHSF